MPRRRQDSEAGYVLVTALIALSVMALLSAGAVRQATSAVRTADQAVRSEQALYMANAGVEWALAAYQAAPDDFEMEIPREHPTISFGDGVRGSYSLDIDRLTDSLHITSTGTVNGGRETTTRVVEAEIPLVPGGTEPPPDGVPFLFKQAILANGQVRLPQNAKVCGDIITTGQIYVENNAEVWGQTETENQASPCKSVIGTGKAISSQQVQFANNGWVQGGWCDPNNWGAGTPCATKPKSSDIVMPSVNMTALKERAAEWWVQSPQACNSKPVGAECRVLSSNLLYLDGTLSFDRPALVYINATVRMDNSADLRVNGKVTFAIDGQVQISNNAKITCGTDSCPIAIVAKQDVQLSQNAEVHASIHTASQFTGEQNATVFGNVVAQSTNLSQNYVQHGQRPLTGDYPPGLITQPGEYTGDTRPSTPPSGSFSHWK